MATIQYNCGDKTFQILMPDHHRSHEWPNFAPGNDPVSLYPRAWAFLRTEYREGTVIMDVSAFYYIDDDGVFHVFREDSINLTNNIPLTPNRARLVAICLDTTTDTLVAINGAEALNSALTPLQPPTIPETCIPSALVRLQTGQLEVEETDITDIREFLHPRTYSITKIKELIQNLQDQIDDIEDGTTVIPGTGGTGGGIDCNLLLLDSEYNVICDSEGNYIVGNATSDELGFSPGPY